MLSVEHVAALNTIELAFEPSRFTWLAKSDAAVIEAYRLYAQHLNITVDPTNVAADIAWTSKTRELFIALLMKMAKAVGFKAEQERLQSAYLPRAHSNVEKERLTVLSNAAKVLSGEQAIKMAVVDFPFSREATDLQHELQKALIALVADGTIKVTLKSPFN